MSTPNQILTRALAHSSKNKPGLTAATFGAAEGLQIVIETLRTFFQIGARFNPEFFGDTDDIDAVDGAWPRPATADSIFQIERVDDPTPIATVPFDDRLAAEGRPAVYRFGQQYYPAGNAEDPDPISDSLRFYFAAPPAVPATADTAIDARWPERFDELLELEVAIRAALKDGRNEEVAQLVARRDAALGRFLSFLEHEDANEVRRSDRRINTPAMVPLASLLAGGTSLKV